MIRAFQTTTLRRQVDLSGLWQMTAGGKDYTVYVPGCRENIPGLESYRGESTYVREVTCSGHVLLHFAGVSHTARVWLDDRYAGDHNGAYTGFSLPLSGVPAGVHRLRVDVDNSFGEHSALSVPNDYMTYGGITRPCVLEEVSSLYIAGVQLLPELRGGQWYLHAAVSLNNLGEAAEAKIRCEVGGAAVPLGTIMVAAGEKTVLCGEFAVPDAQVYELDTPRLTSVRCVLSVGGADVDDQIERTGLRTVAVIGRQILFNGKPIHIRGFNRHEDFGMFGCAIPPAAMMQDIQLIRDLGGNAVRTCHYPNDPYFLDLCDEAGLLVWEESHARGLQEKQMLNPNFMPQSLACIDEMIARDVSHPAIFIWGLLNECASDSDKCRPMFEELIGRIRALDASRPVTFATCRPGSEVFGEAKAPVPGFSDGDQCLDLCDVISFNIYPGWYHEDATADFLRRTRSWAESHEGAGKPFIVSEIGAGAIYGWRSRTHDKWSEERQAEILREQLTGVLADPEVTGVFLWQLADCRISSECFYGRPRTMNNKGVVDEYRRPKLSYDVVRELFARDAASR